MKKPDFLMAWNEKFNVTYDINPWMSKNINNVDNALAYEQWVALREALENEGAKVDVILVNDPSIPDIVFTANAGVLHGNIFTISRFAYPQRQQEVTRYGRWVLDQKDFGLQFVQETFEGAGDALVDNVNMKLWLGHGFRTDPAVIEPLKELYQDLEIIDLKLINPHFYHLDTCFCPLRSGHALITLEAFDTPSINKVTEVYGDKIIAVSPEDASNFACNAVEFNGSIFINKCSPRLNYELENIGYNVVELDFSEFIKSGGSAKCLTLRIN